MEIQLVTKIHKGMKESNIGLRAVIILIMLALHLSLSAGEGSQIRKRAFRVLLVIGDQWDDPAGYVVGPPAPTGEYSGYDAAPGVEGASDFYQLALLLKAWAIPFDIVRLDQQWLDRYMFLDIHGSPKYGTILWDVNKSDKLLPQDFSIIQDIVRNWGVGLIAIADRITQPEIQDLLGLKYTGSWESNSLLKTVGSHFITSGLSSPFIIDTGIVAHLQRQQAELADGTIAIVEQGSVPQVTVKTYPSGSHAVWIGNDHNHLFGFGAMRTLLRRAITWTIGFSLYKTWEDEVIMIMDDPGGSANNWLEHWHYPELSEDIIEKYLIAPCKKHKAVLNINFVPAFVNDQKRMLEPTWTASFTDAFGTRQDYISAWRGYDKGVRAGVFEVLSHGLTHMQPDLVSDPGWYGSPLDRERSEVGWYREFGDTRRKKEIPPAEQLWRMKTSREWLTEQFGKAPLAFTPGGLGTSVSYFCNTARLAGEAGYGWYGWEYGYLGKDMAFTGWKFPGTPESPLIIGAPPDYHDFGISRQPEEFESVFTKYPGKRFISINEFIGYLHAENTGFFDPGDKTLSIAVNYDPMYCVYFHDHGSEWRLELADWLLKDAGKIASITADGKALEVNSTSLEITAGTGRHEVKVDFR